MVIVLATGTCALVVAWVCTQDYDMILVLMANSYEKKTSTSPVILVTGFHTEFLLGTGNLFKIANAL
jgi:hypothetical protein